MRAVRKTIEKITCPCPLPPPPPQVTCPGVCICPRGTVYLDVRLFGCTGSTSCAEPRFPLVFNETFSFHEVGKKITRTLCTCRLSDRSVCLFFLDVAEFRATRRLEGRSNISRRRIRAHRVGAGQREEADRFGDVQKQRRRRTVPRARPAERKRRDIFVHEKRAFVSGRYTLIRYNRF